MGEIDSFKASGRKSKIIPMIFDVNFYYSRAMRHLERRDYAKALKYYWKTVDLEPNDPIHYCNIATILAEMGLFRESNELLIYVIDKLDTNLLECYYFIGSNYINLDDLEMGFKYIQRYLDADPNGEYVGEALDILSYISVEVNDYNNSDTNNEDKEKFILHSNAKDLLDEGKFLEALDRLKNIVDEYPDFTVARNNLSLAYFYIENYDKAIEQIKAVLDQDLSNVHALCNLTIFYKHLKLTDEHEYLVKILLKLYPYHKEQVYKLATTFAILEEHEMVYMHLSKIVNKGEVFDSTFLHYCAIAAYNTKRYDYAKKCWQQIYKLDPDSIVAKYYLEVIMSFNFKKGKDTILPSFFYQYKLPIEELISLSHRQSKNYKNQLLFNSLAWGLKRCNKYLKEQIIHELKSFNSSEAEQVLRDFLLDDEESKEIKKKILVVLEEMNAKPPYLMSINGKLIKKERWIPDFKLWENNWLEVIAIIDKDFIGIYNVIELYDAKLLWYKFISKTYPNISQKRKPDGWVAAIEYIVAKMHRKPLPFKDLSLKYGVTINTISRNVKELDKVLDINK
ncbi:MAG: tetratricopeptide repeat protein [Vulcanibacillus sp.]